jgi:hypothetical protein
MKYSLKTTGQTYQFTETASGLLDLSSGAGLTPDTVQSFQFDEINRQATLEMQGDSTEQLMRAFHYRFLVKAARILSFYEAGASFKSAIWINYDFVGDFSYVTLLGGILGKQACQEVFFEFALGVYGNPDLSKTNTARLIGGVPKDMDQAARKWYTGAESFSTRVTGFGYRKDRFTRPAPDSDRLTLSAGDPVFVIREPHNHHDSNAVSLLWKNGEKLGYLRRNIAAHIAPLMDHGRLYTACIAAVLGHFRPDDERVYVRIEKIHKDTENPGYSE